MSVENHWAATTVAAVLDRLEGEEARLLSWGIVDAGFTMSEVRNAIEEVLEQQGEDPDLGLDLLEDLEVAGLLHRATEATQELWRTRSAETIRLISKLRQLLPKHGKQPGGWLSAPSLVSDFRYSQRPRAYPRRHIERSDVTSTIPAGQLTPNRREALNALLRSNDRALLLSDYQVRSITEIFAGLESNRNNGVIIGAGTGSGKTLAFYLPALAHMADSIDSSSWTKCLTIYPRKELLKDQLRQTYTEARRLDGLLLSTGGRKLRLGAYYGDTPWNEKGVKTKWKEGQSGYRCPYLICPICDGALEWATEDLDARQTRLTCQKCGHKIESNELSLTRQQMAQDPPDILFTTTEMLNRRLADTANRHVFGLGCRRQPELVLLDEVHTYDGTTGAQVGMLLRRWKRQVDNRVVFAGLSATLREAQDFFGQLVGLPVDRVSYVTPDASELEHEGIEYLLALRANPSSGTSVLSTTIQTAMVLTRCLDPQSMSSSAGLYGHRTFVFTDALDVTNRLYFDLADAEGLDSWGNPRKPSLAVLREPTVDTDPLRRVAGQSWDLPVTIGHHLGPADRLQVDRTSSQDVGVAVGADIVVATSALEVGFDDPTVGAVIQHKAPRGAAAFLQRKGRAGRPRIMRPWTVVVLSDFGRDRIAYQTYDALFDPELAPRYLPVRNTYVLRMHAIQAVFDWLSSRAKLNSLSPWDDLSRPANTSKWGRRLREKQLEVVSLLERVLTDSRIRRQLSKYVESALQISSDLADDILWRPPRPVLLGAIPTLLRRLRTSWQVAEPDTVRAQADDWLPHVPLPDFISSALFNPLNLPEVQVLVPPQTKHDEPSREPMHLIQALREFAPGRVSRRFGINNTYNRHWLATGDYIEEERQQVIIDEVFDYEYLGDFKYPSDAGPQSISVVRPYRIFTEKVPREYSDSSNSFLNWHTQVVPTGKPLTLDLPKNSRWANTIRGLDAFIHAAQSHLELRRFSRGADADFRRADGTRWRSRIEFADKSGAGVAVGGIFHVDGIKVQTKVPSFEWLWDTKSHPGFVRGFRSAYLRHCVETDATLSENTDLFQRRWLHDLLVAALVEEARAGTRSLKEAFEHVRPNFSGHLVDVLRVLVERTPEDDGTSASIAKSQVVKSLEELCRSEEVLHRLGELAPLLWTSPPGWENWAQERYLSTFGEAFFAACQGLCPEYSPDEVILDISPPASSSGVFWITETTIGGAGFVETAVRRIHEDPRRFLLLLEASLRPSDLESVDEQLTAILYRLKSDSGLSEAFGEYRSAKSHKELRVALNRVLERMRLGGVATTHAVVAATAARLLRPGSSESTDELLRELLSSWSGLERELEVEVDLRMYAYVASSTDSLDNSLGHTPSGDRRQWRLDTIEGLLWMRGWNARATALTSYNPYSTAAPSDRLLVTLSNPDPTKKVSLEDEDWLAHAHDVLASAGTVEIQTEADTPSNLSLALATLTVAPIDVGYFHAYPRIVEVRQETGMLTARLDIAEVLA